jgi:uncharacterized protein with FMN-binding domain
MPHADSAPKGNKKIANSLVALSSAAILAVYAAGYTRTKAAAEKFEQQSDDRRPRQAPPVRAQVVEASLTTIPLPVAAPAPAETPKETPKPEENAKAVEQAPAAAPLMAKVVPATPVAAPVAVVTAAPAPAATPAPVATPAPAPVTAPAAAAAPMSPPGPWKDGVWKGWGTCRHGDIQAAVKIENGKITQAGVADCETRYSCDIIDKLPPQVLRKQSADVDRVGGATQSSDAFYYAIYEALRQAAEAFKTNASGTPVAGAAAPVTAPVTTGQSN